MAESGRAGRVRLEQRLQMARHGAALLDRKQRIMLDELERLQLNADNLRREWEEEAREAARWLRRAMALDGATAIARAAPAVPATVVVRVAVAMGVAYPDYAECAFPDGPAAQGSSALVLATRAHRAAMERAALHAAAERAVARLTAELTATRTRQRAVENRWIPRLEGRLEAVRRTIEQRELEETLRVHWAAEQATEQQPRAAAAGGEEAQP